LRPASRLKFGGLWFTEVLSADIDVWELKHHNDNLQLQSLQTLIDTDAIMI